MVLSKINYDSKHLRKGDALPSWNGKVRVYNMRLCPFAQRTILALNAKQIDYEVVNIDLLDKPEWLFSKSTFGKVPAIEVEDGVSICESRITVEYLDDVYTQRPLFSKDPVKKPTIRLLWKLLNQAPDTINEDTKVDFYKALDFLEEQLKSRGGIFFGGDLPGYADYMMWPWFERLLAIDDKDFKIEAPKHSLLANYLQQMLKDPAVSQYLVPKEVFDKFHREYSAGIFKVQSIEK